MGISKCIAIVAADPNGVIGSDGAMPWHYKADFKRFKERTMGGTMIMGRKTWESLPKPLPGRRCIVLTSQANPASKHPANSCEYADSWDHALISAGSDQHGANYPEPGILWIAGGAAIYEDAILRQGDLVDEIDLTTVPEVSAEKLGVDIVRFDQAWLKGFELVETVINAEDDRLKHSIWRRQS